MQNDISSRIRSLRLKKGLTQEELGNRVGLKKAAIQKYENGSVENIKRSIIQKLAIVLETTPIYLMAWEEENSIVFPDIIPIYSKLNEDNRNKIYSQATELLNEQEINNKYSDNILYPHFKNYADSIAYIEENDKSAALSGRTVSDMDEEEVVRYANNLKDFIDKIRSEINK